MDAYAALGLDLEITELDLSVYKWAHGPSPLTIPAPGMLEAQAERFANLLAVLLEYRTQVTGITWWGVADDHTWLDSFPEKDRKNWPLLFDVAHRPKPVYAALQQAMSSLVVTPVPQTRLENALA